ncbi:hypothetical protein HDE69_000415 [Pedobacter cryoconitis]|uniref:Uncharacterized protein n=1 Tax=Pedobacter cryoconitis TaxID=188932 RepID=A0A7W8YPE6_9SPHI|nr:hypothetical protein [Pedobacter cryoconitis]MBB5644668.1 hypothetical protein [Pedobacter cryoconitis]
MRKQLIFKNLMMLFVVSCVIACFISRKKGQQAAENKTVYVSVQETKTWMENNIIVPCPGKSC